MANLNLKGSTFYDTRCIASVKVQCVIKKVHQSSMRNKKSPLRNKKNFDLYKNITTA